MVTVPGEECNNTVRAIYQSTTEFTTRVDAKPGTYFWLPEVSMGLIPGAGGTVSLPRRIGRQRTNYFALSQRRIDAETALRWGLIDGML